MDTTMSSKELEALQKLRKNVYDILEEKHDDGFLIRWLRARQCDPQKAEKMLRSSLDWRKTFDADSLLDNFRPTEVLREYLPIRIGDKAKDGSTILFYPCGFYDVRGALYSCKKIDVLKWIVYSLEKNVLKMEERKKHSQYVIIDLENFSIRTFMWKPVLDLVRDVVTTYDANYPELLHKAILINAPTVFSMAFAVIKPFIDARTINKISIYGTEGWQQVLLKDIEKNELLQHYGGNKANDSADDPDWSCNIFEDRIVPESFFKKGLLFEEKDVTVSTVSMASCLKVEVEIDRIGTAIKWEFQTEQNDIGFSISVKTPNGNEEILPMERVSCYLVPQDGIINCTKIGTYEICFDNSYSFLRSKRLAYRIEKVSLEY